MFPYQNPTIQKGTGYPKAILIHKYIQITLVVDVASTAALCKAIKPSRKWIRNDELQRWTGEHTGSNYTANHGLHITVLDFPVSLTQMNFCTAIKVNTVTSNFFLLFPYTLFFFFFFFFVFSSSSSSSSSSFLLLLLLFFFFFSSPSFLLLLLFFFFFSSSFFSSFLLLLLLSFFFFSSSSSSSSS
jgi:hypothetical protein